ncbi:CaiB/BaiF CoA transferase family protein [Amycolatopsis sp. H20-H5]|uniref:CaiB/BaiF CoA transferase family protein n=1 Tax=Amycolatopsis sp. H20-H5 TaxID=3046309 RepID=UPI002DBB98A5|nr:CaiB/BaiF CoA-transferase family protein [Amycolatopsis sp. H20-H5]MEC3980716.1 CaiB/BaiF CoA-transferase family protein [Amycolatopsis sp. H20-H5]
MSGPLAGLVVVSLEQAVAAPLATRHLADLGARVLKIERPGTGDFARGYDRTVHGLSSHFVWLNRGKESVALDVKSEQGARTLRRLIDRADVFVQNLAPGAADRLGVGSAVLAESHPELITCDISGYGATGGYRHRKAYDLLIQCEAGLVSITGGPDAPAKAGVSVADIAAGMYAYSGILTALYERRATGRGQNLEVSMLEALGEWMGYPYYYTNYGGTAPARAGVDHPTIAPYGAFVTADGVTIQIGLQNDREWREFCTSVLVRADLVVDPRFSANADRVVHRAVLDGLIGEVFAGLDEAELVKRLENAKIAHARQRTMAEFAAHPQLAERDRWRSVATPAGPVDALLPPVTVRGREPVMGPVPALGEHTGEVLAWLDTPS